MACCMNVIGVFVLIGRVVAEQKGQAQGTINEVDNAEQFALLCRIYNVAKNLPIDHVDLQNPYKIVNEINALNASLAEPKWLNETEQMESDGDAQLKPTNTREAAVAQAILRRITQKAHTILEEIGRVNATRNIEKSKAEFVQVIYGEVGNESYLCQGALKDVRDRAEACGNSGLKSKGNSAGKNLVVDFSAYVLRGRTATKKELTISAGFTSAGVKKRKSRLEHGMSLDILDHVGFG